MGRDHLERTEFERFDDRIVVIRHREGTQVGREDILANIEHVKKTFPGVRLLLIDHCHSYSLTYDAFEVLRETAAFDAMASVIARPKHRARVETALGTLKLRVPFGVFGNWDEAVAFLHRHGRPAGED